MLAKSMPADHRRRQSNARDDRVVNGDAQERAQVATLDGLRAGARS